MLILPIALGALLYGGGYIAQFLYNYDVWQAAGGVFGTAPEFPDGNFFICIAAVFCWPYGLYGVGGCIAALGVLVFMVMRMGYSETGVYDRERNLIYSNKGTYGTAGFMTKKELKGVRYRGAGSLLGVAGRCPRAFQCGQPHPDPYPYHRPQQFGGPDHHR